jgi:hypothetical protein
VSDESGDNVLRKIAAWPQNDPCGWFDAIEASWDCYMGEFSRTRWTHELIIGESRNNDAIVRAMQGNWLWNRCWESSHRGGKYVFVVPPIFRATAPRKAMQLNVLVDPPPTLRWELEQHPAGTGVIRFQWCDKVFDVIVKADPERDSADGLREVLSQMVPEAMFLGGAIH